MRSPTVTCSRGFYAEAMNDALWDMAFARLMPGQRAPEVVWPRERVHLVKGLSGDRIDEDDLAPRHSSQGTLSQACDGHESA
jgi:hypothetical protein